MNMNDSKAPTPHTPPDTSWSIQVDEAYAERMIRAHNKTYRRKTGKGYFIFCLLFDVLVVAGTVKCLMEGLNLFDEFNGFAGMIGAYIVFPGLTIFFGVLAFGPDKGGFFGLKRVAHQLAEELAPNGKGTLSAQATASGITLSSETGTLLIPYAACYDTAVIDGETFVLVGNDKEQSVLYHMAGNNAYLRDNIGFAFAAPAELANSIIEAGKSQLAQLSKDTTASSETISSQE